MTASPSRAARRIERRIRPRALGLGMPVPAAARVANSAVTQVIPTSAGTDCPGGSWACLGEGRRGDLVNGTTGVIDTLSSLAGEPQFIERTAP